MGSMCVSIRIVTKTSIVTVYYSSIMQCKHARMAPIYTINQT